MSITLPAAPAPATPVFKVHQDPACPTCGCPDPVLHELPTGGIYTGCCQADPVVFVCALYLNVYFSPEGDEPDECPYGDACM